MIGSFATDSRIQFWDIYNEPGNSNHGKSTLRLLSLVFQWARASNPDQPISSGPWNYGGDFQEMNDFQLSNSDVITFHSYDVVENTKGTAENMLKLGRPVINTEYMARPTGSKFQTHIPMFHDLKVGAINWGLVKGKTNTIFPWNSPEGAPEPKVWFHDVFHPDGTPFDQEEVDVISKYAKMCSKPAQPS